MLRHLDTCEYQTFVHARIPRVDVRVVIPDICRWRSQDGVLGDHSRNVKPDRWTAAHISRWMARWDRINDEIWGHLDRAGAPGKP